MESCSTEKEQEQHKEQSCHELIHNEPQKALPMVHISAENIAADQDTIATDKDSVHSTFDNTKNNLITSDTENEQASQIAHKFSKAPLARSEVHYLKAIIVGALTNYNLLESLRSSLSKSTLLSVLVEHLLAPLFFANHHSTSVCKEEYTTLPVSTSKAATSISLTENISHASTESDTDTHQKNVHPVVTSTKSLNSDIYNANTVSEEVSWNSIGSFCPLIMHTYADIKHCCFHHGEAFPVLLTSSPWNIDEILNFPVSLSSLQPPPQLSLQHNSAVAQTSYQIKAMLTAEVVEAIISHTLELLQSYPERVCNPFWCKVDTHGNISFMELSPTVYRSLYVTETTFTTESNSSVTTQETKKEEENVLLLLCFYDFSSFPQSICWAMRNVLTCLRLAIPSMKRVNLFAVRSLHSKHNQSDNNEPHTDSKSSKTSQEKLHVDIHYKKNSCVLFRCSCKPLDEERVQSTLCDLERQYNAMHTHEEKDEKNSNNNSTISNSLKLNKDNEDKVLTNYKVKAQERVTTLTSTNAEYSLSSNSIIQVTGWRHKAVNKIDLSRMLDPIQRAERDTRMNLELMQWRVLPSLELNSLAQCKVLILGTGTLGCHVARNLIMWGVRHITLYDRGTVSFSNLARQSLFTFNDAEVGRGKAQAAAEALRRILPSIHVNAFHGMICMPGHRLQESSLEKDEQHELKMQLQENWTLYNSENAYEHAVQELLKLIALMKSHDVVFLLTDSREARWVPSVIAASESIPIINVALGFDTFVVMRHGIRHVPYSADDDNESDFSRYNVDQESYKNNNENCEEKERIKVEKEQNELELGCYFCADVVAPRDSMSMRALDQQCTVTRPGVSSMASAIAVELLASIYQHPQKFHCPAYHANIRKNSTYNTQRTNAMDSESHANEEKKNASYSNSVPSANFTVHDSKSTYINKNNNNRTTAEYTNDNSGKLGESRLGIIPQQIRGNVFSYSLSHLVGERNPCCTACSDGTIAAYRANPVEFIMKCVYDPQHIEEVCGIKALKSQWEKEMTDMEWNSDSENESECSAQNDEDTLESDNNTRENAVTTINIEKTVYKEEACSKTTLLVNSSSSERFRE